MKTKNTAIGDQFYDKGISLFQKDDVQSYANFQKAISYYKLSHDSSNISKSLIYQANIQHIQGDYSGAEETLVEALTYMKDGDESFFSVYGTMANIKLLQKEYKSSIEWSDKALNENIDYQTKAKILNNKAVSLSKIHNYKNSIKILNSIILDSISNKNFTLIVRDNKEYINWLFDNSYPAEDSLEKILQLRIAENDNWGLHSNYIHLVEINKVKNPEKSLYYAKKMLSLAKISHNPEDKLEALEKILYTDNPSNLKKAFIEYKTLSDSIQKNKNNYKSQFAYIKYDSQKKSEENQKLKLDNAQGETLLLQQQFASVALAISIIIIIVWYRKRQIRLKQEKELEVKNTELKMSKKVHDVVANGIYQVMTKIENQESFDKEKALDELEFVYEKSRDISYDKLDQMGSPKDCKEKISNLIASFKNDDTETYTVGNEDEIWTSLPQSHFEEIYQVIRELLVNMKKHSRASRVVFKFERFENQVQIHYTDNGIGIPGDITHKNGLTNTVSRMAAIKGAIIFDTKTEKGLKINISFPVS